MEQIIQQIAAGLVEKVLNRIECGEIADLDALSDGCLKDCKKAAADIITSVITFMNKEVRRDKRLRRQMGLKMQCHDRERTVLTSLGEVSYKRDYYKEEAIGQYRFPIDDMLRVGSYERVGKGTCAKLVNMAADVSYQKAADIVSGGGISRQTVKNKIREAGVLEKDIPPNKQYAKELHIHADEDHAHIQMYRRKGKKNRKVPYIVLTEGTAPVYEGRSKTVNAVHFADKDLDSKALWAKVSAYIDGTYENAWDIPIYIHSDGGNWIKGYREVLPYAIPVMDMFHFRKELKKANRHCLEGVLSRTILWNIGGDDEAVAWKKCTGAVNRAIGLAQEEKAGEELLKFRTYLMNHWEAIRNAFCLNTTGSCTEGQISHGLSERISRNPMGWSEEGVGNMAMLRAFRKNGCRVNADDFRRGEKEKETSRLEEYSREMLTGALKGRRDWSIFSGERYGVYQSTGTQYLLRTLGRLREVS